METAIDNDDLLTLRPEILATPTGKLANLLSNEIAQNVQGGASGTASSFLPILIELLPVLADLLARNCNPTPESTVKALQTTRPFLRRRYENQVSTWTLKSQGRDAYNELGGRKFGGIFLNVCGNEANADLVEEALLSPRPVEPPMWAIFAE